MVYTMPGNMSNVFFIPFRYCGPAGLLKSSYRVLIEFIHVIPEILSLYYDTVVTVLVARYAAEHLLLSTDCIFTGHIPP